MGRATAARFASRPSRRSSPACGTKTFVGQHRRSRTPTTASWRTSSEAEPYSVVPRVPGGEITPEKLDRARRGRQAIRTVHEDHRRPADRPVRRPRASTCPRSGSNWSTPVSRAATRTARRCGPSRAASARPGAATACRTPSVSPSGREPLQGRPAPHKIKIGRFGLRPRMCRGAEQGLRPDRHGEGLEPLRLRQRRRQAAPRRPARSRHRRRDLRSATSIAS